MASAEEMERANETDFHWNEREYIDDFFFSLFVTFILRYVLY